MGISGIRGCKEPGANLEEGSMTRSVRDPSVEFGPKQASANRRNSTGPIQGNSEENKDNDRVSKHPE